MSEGNEKPTPSEPDPRGIGEDLDRRLAAIEERLTRLESRPAATETAAADKRTVKERLAQTKQKVQEKSQERGAKAPAFVPPGGATPGGTAAAAAARKPKKLPNFEELIGGRFFTWVGGLVLVVALAFFIPYAWTHFNTPDWVKVLALHLLGVGILVASQFLFRRGLRIAAQCVAGLGIFELYGTAYASLNVFEVYGEWFGSHNHTVAFLECSVITVLAVLISLRTNSIGVILIGALCGYLTPPLTTSGSHNGEGLFTYLAFLNVALLWCAVARGWVFLKPVSLVATGVMFLLWFVDDGLEHMTHLRHEVFLAVHASILFLGSYAPAVVRRIRSHPVDHFMLPATSLAFFGGTMLVYFLEEMEFFTKFAVGLAVIELLLFDIARRRLETSDRLPRVVLAVGMIFVTLIPVFAYGEDGVRHLSVTWATEALVFMLIACFYADRQMLFSAFFVTLLSILMLMSDVAGSKSGGDLIMGLEPHAFRALLCAVIVMIAGTTPLWMTTIAARDALSTFLSAARPLAGVLFGAGNVLLMWGLSIQWEDRLLVFLWSINVAVLWCVGFLFQVPPLRWFAFSIGFLFLNVGLIGAGVRLSEPYTVLTNARFLSIANVAAVFIAAGYMYRRWRRNDALSAQEQGFGPWVGLFGHVLVVTGLCFEIDSWFSSQIEHANKMAEMASYSVCLALYAAFLVVIGFWLKEKVYRVAGLVAFGPILLKVFIVDLSELEALPRIMAFFVLGVMLIAVSLLYQKFKSRVEIERTEAESDQATGV